MVRAAIVSPFEVWSVGMQSILLGHGLDVIERRAELGGAALRADLLVLAWRCLMRPHGHAHPRRFNGHFRGRVVLVLEPEDDLNIQEFIALEVEGLVLSSAPIADLAECIDSVLCGNRWIDAGVRALLGHGHHALPHFHDLSSREHEVARLAATGLSNKKIARALELSDGTVKMHMHHILAKLRLASRFELTQAGDGAWLETPGVERRTRH